MVNLLEKMMASLKKDDQTVCQVLDTWALELCNCLDSKSQSWIFAASSKADVMTEKVTLLSGDLKQSYSETVACVASKAEDLTSQVEEKCSQAKINLMSKADSVTTCVQNKYAEVSEKTVAIQLKVAEIKCIAVVTAQEIKEELKKEGIVKVSSNASRVVKDQAVSAYNTVRRDGTMALVQEVKQAVEEAFNTVNETELPTATELPMASLDVADAKETKEVPETLNNEASPDAGDDKETKQVPEDLNAEAFNDEALNDDENMHADDEKR